MSLLDRLRRRNGHDPATPADDAIGASALFGLLSSFRRRRTIELLDDASTSTLTLKDLSEAIAADEVPVVNADARKRVYISLYQCHLPALDQEGVVEYTDRDHEVRPGPHYETALAALRRVQPLVEEGNTLE